MEETEPEAGKESNQPQKTFLTVKSQGECTAYDPGVDESPPIWKRDFEEF